MKKSLITFALISAVSGVASADDVTLYGRADLGLVYTHNEFKQGTQSTKSHAFSMESGNGGASRFGLTGNERLGNGTTINFVLENGFEADSGELTGGAEGRLFDREASIAIIGSYGALRVGRMATILSDAGSMGYFATAVNPFGTGWGTDIASHTNLFANQIGVMDNVVGYISPTLGGLTVYGQYGMGAQEQENKATSDRYAALGLKYAAGAFELAGAVDWTNKKSVDGTQANSLKDVKDAITINLGGSYDFGVVKTYATAQYFKNASDVASLAKSASELQFTSGPIALNNAEGFGLAFAASLPLGAGRALFSTGMMDGDLESAGVTTDLYAFAVSGAYTYSLSKRTTLYAALGYIHKKLEQKSHQAADLTTHQAALGMINTF